MPVLVVVLIVLASVPSYFSAYRDAAFDATPRDDYAKYLLAMTGLTGDGPHRQPETFPGVPMAHRPLSVVIALPFYYTLPYYPFSQLDEPDEPYLRAVAALALVGWLCMLLTAVAVYAIARHKHRSSQVAAYIAALLALFLFGFVGLDGVDPLAILLVAVVIYYIDRPIVVVPIVLISVAVNEKLIIVVLVLTGARLLAWLISHRPAGGFRYWPQLCAGIVAFVAYGLFRQVVLPRPDVGEYAGQLDPTSWLGKMLETIDLTLSIKGVITNGVPLAVMAILVIIAWIMAPRLRPGSVSFERPDVLVALALVVTAGFIGMQYTAGRLVLHSFPLYLPMLAVLVDLYVRSRAITEPAEESAAVHAQIVAVRSARGGRSPDHAGLRE